MLLLDEIMQKLDLDILNTKQLKIINDYEKNSSFNKGCYYCNVCKL